jgi:hypothetical protein
MRTFWRNASYHNLIAGHERLWVTVRWLRPDGSRSNIKIETHRQLVKLLLGASMWLAPYKPLTQFSCTNTLNPFLSWQYRYPTYTVYMTLYWKKCIEFVRLLFHKLIHRYFCHLKIFCERLCSFLLTKL